MKIKSISAIINTFLFCTFIITTTDNKQIIINSENVIRISSVEGRRVVYLQSDPSGVYTYEATSYIEFKMEKCHEN